MMCAKRGCSRARFAGSDRCFDHHDDSGVPVFFGLWFAFCTLVALATLCLIGWAVIELVSWVTSQ